MTGTADYKIKITAQPLYKATLQDLQNSLERVGETTGISKLAGMAGFASQKFAALTGAISGVLGPLAAFGGAGAAGFGLFEMAKSASDFGAQLYLASQKTGVAVDALAKLHYVGQTANVDIGQMDKALFRLNLTIQRAAAGKGKDAIAMFRGLHIPLRDAKGHMRDLVSVFDDLSDAASKHPAIQQLIAGTAFGGRMGGDMIPVLTKSREELKKLYATFEQSYGRLTPQIVRNAYEAHEAFGRLGVAAEGLKFTMGALLAPALETVVVALTEIVLEARKLPDWFSKQLKITRPDVDALGTSFHGLGDAFYNAWQEAQPLRDVLKSFGGVFDPFGQIKDWPDWMKKATPALTDFLDIFRGDAGAAMRTIARALGNVSAILRELAELEGGLAGKHPLSVQRLKDAWAGKKLTAAAINPGAAKLSLSDNVWDTSRWFDFSAGGKAPLGVRMNNPGNLRAWGNTPTEMTASGKFAHFATAGAGISAAAGNLMAYGRHGWNTIDKIISHWAPSSENNTAAYIRDVSRRTGFAPGAALNLRDPDTIRRLLTAIFAREQGGSFYSQSAIASGVNSRRAAVDVNVKIGGLPRDSTAHVAKKDAPHLGDVGMAVAWANI